MPTLAVNLTGNQGYSFRVPPHPPPSPTRPDTVDLTLPRVKRLLPDREYQVVRTVVRARSLPPAEIASLRSLVRGWRDKYVDRAHQQAREARGKGKPRSTRGSESNENTMRQADIMDWVLERLGELEEAGASAPTSPSDSRPRKALPVPSRAELREALAQPHVSTFGDLWAEFPDTPVDKLRKALWALVEAGEVELDTGGGVQLTAEEEVAFVEEVQSIAGVSVERRARSTRELEDRHRERFARTKVVRVRSHNRARGARNQAKRDTRGKGRR